MRAKIRLDTLSDIRKFVDITSSENGKIVLIDGSGMCVNAKSLIGTMYTTEWSEVWCESDKDIYQKIKEFVIL